jgi:hypothetical protein
MYELFSDIFERMIIIRYLLRKWLCFRRYVEQSKMVEDEEVGEGR